MYSFLSFSIQRSICQFRQGHPPTQPSLVVLPHSTHKNTISEHKTRKPTLHNTSNNSHINLCQIITWTPEFNKMNYYTHTHNALWPLHLEVWLCAIYTGFSFLHFLFVLVESSVKWHRRFSKQRPMHHHIWAVFSAQACWCCLKLHVLTLVGD